MGRRVRVINITKNIWFDTIGEAAVHAKIDSWTMSKKMETSGSFVDANGDEYIRETPMRTKNKYKNTSKKLCKKGSHTKRTGCKPAGFTFTDLPTPVQQLINEKISDMLVNDEPWSEIKSFMLKMGCKKIILNIENL